MRSLSSSDGAAPSWVRRVVRPNVNLVCVIGYLAALAYILAVCWPEFNNKTYFSENALLPGLADEEFNHKIRISTYNKQLKQHMSTKTDSTFMPSLWLKDEMTAIGLEAYVQNFTVNLPGMQLSGANVYGVLRAPRGTGTESIVVVVPFRRKTIALVATLLAFANYCREQVYWAKDLIFIVADHETIGAQAWLSAYYEDGQNDWWLNTSALATHVGAVHAALAVDTAVDVAGQPQHEFSHADVRFNMVNGKLPNLDMVNLAIKMAEKEAMTPTVFAREQPWDLNTFDGFETMVLTAASGLAAQAWGGPNGIHGVFGGYGIEAVTLLPYMASRRSASRGGAAGWVEVARVMESTVRSVNNLLERFHQSFFYYFLPATHRYVSIGLFMPAVGLMLLAPLLKAVMIWIDLSEKDEQSEKDKRDQIDAPSTDQPESIEQVEGQNNVLGAMPYLLAAHAYGCLVYFVADRLYFAENFDYLLPVLMAIFVIQLLTPMLINWRVTPSADGSVLRVLALMELSLVIGVTSVLNFGLGLATGLVAVPVFTATARHTGRLHRLSNLVNTCLLLLIHPLTLVGLYHCFVIWQGSAATTVSNAVRDSLLETMRQRDIYGNALFGFLCHGILPLWTTFWMLAQ